MSLMSLLPDLNIRISPTEPGALEWGWWTAPTADCVIGLLLQEYLPLVVDLLCCVNDLY